MKKVNNKYWTKIRIERFAKSLARQEKKLFGKYNEILVNTIVRPNQIGLYQMMDEKKRRTIERYRNKRINKSDRLKKYQAQVK